MNRTEILASLGDLNALSSEIREINEANGWREGDRFQWEDPHKIPSYIALIHSEISEAWEAGEAEIGDAFAEELADVAIRILDMMEGAGLRLDTSIGADAPPERDGRPPSPHQQPALPDLDGP